MAVFKLNGTAVTVSRVVFIAAASFGVIVGFLSPLRPPEKSKMMVDQIKQN